MKKIKILVTVAIMIPMASCGQRAPKKTTSEELLSSTVRIERVTDKVLNSFDSFYEYSDSDYGEKIIIWTTEIRKNFDFISVGAEFTGEQSSFFAEDILYSIKELSTQKALVIKMLISEGIPSRGISFLDEDNTKRYFYISESGFDGSLSMVEFQNSSYENVVSNEEEADLPSTPREQTILELVGLLNLNFERDKHTVNYWTDGLDYIFPCSTNPNEWPLSQPPAANIVYFNVAEGMGVDLGMKIAMDANGNMTLFEDSYFSLKKGDRVEHRIIGDDTLLLFSDAATGMIKNVFKKFDGDLDEKMSDDYRRYLLAGTYQRQGGSADPIVFNTDKPVVSGFLAKGETTYTFGTSGGTTINILVFNDKEIYQAEKTLTGLELTPMKAADPKDESYDWANYGGDLIRVIADPSKPKIILVKTAQAQSGLPDGIFPLASTSVMTEWELKRYAGRYDDEMYRHLQTMRDEIFARHGQKFAPGSEPDKYFNAQSWYKPQFDDVTSKLTEIERINLALLPQEEGH